MKKSIYLDYAAATPVEARVAEAMRPYLDGKFGNPSSIHQAGVRAKKAIEESRRTVARILHCRPEEIVFTGGGTEAINLAIFGAVRALQHSNILENVGMLYGHVVVSKIEHHAVLRTVEALAPLEVSRSKAAAADGASRKAGTPRVSSAPKEGGPLTGREREGLVEVTYLDVDKYGLVNPNDVKKSLRPDTVLVSIMYANNEIGTVEPIAEIGKVLKEFRAKSQKPIANSRNPIPYTLNPKPLFFTDACQAGGYLDLNIERLGVDLMALNASKIYGPKGAGCLYLRRGIALEPILYGGGQEKGLRSGTENVAGIVGFAKALEIAEEEREKESARLTELRDYFIKEVSERIPGAELNGHISERLANNINISIPGVEGEAVVIYLDQKGVAISTGAACSSVEIEPSHVITALGKSREHAMGSLRFTLGRYTKRKELDYVLKVLPQVIKILQPVKYGVARKKKSREQVPTV